MALIGLFAYMVFVYIRPQEIFEELQGVEVVNYTFLATLVLAMVTERLDLRRLFAPPAMKCLLAFLGAIALSHLSWLYVTGATNSVMYFGKTALLVVLIVWIVNTQARLRALLWVLMVMAVLLCVQGIEQSVTGYNWGGIPMLQQHDLEQPRIRALGTLGDPNDLALALVVMVPFTLGSVFGGGLPRNPLLALPVLGLLLYTIYLTQSRGGFVAVAVVLFAMAHMRWGRKLSLPLAALGLAGAVGYVAMKTSSMDASAWERMWILSEGLQLIKGSPLFGVGQGLFMDHVRHAAHNSMINAMAETGLIGGFFWVGMYYFTCRDLARVAPLVASEDPVLRDLARTARWLLCGLLGALAAAFFLSRTYVIVMYVPLALGVACTQIAARRAPALEAALRPRRRDWQWIAGLEVGATALVWLFVRTVRW